MYIKLSHIQPKWDSTIYQILQKSWQSAWDLVNRDHMFDVTKYNMLVIKITLCPESFVSILPWFFEGATRLRIQTIAPYPTPQDAINLSPNSILINTYKLIGLKSLNELLDQHSNGLHHVIPTIRPIRLGWDMQYLEPLVVDDAMVVCGARDMSYNQITQCLHAAVGWLFSGLQKTIGLLTLASRPWQYYTDAMCLL